MKAFLTSFPLDETQCAFSRKNGFRDAFLSSLGGKCHMVFVASDPNDYKGTEGFASLISSVLEKEGVKVLSCDILDNRNKTRAASLFKKADLVVLAGGHTPTQNEFFASFPLKMILSSYKGTLLGISAGTMNSGKFVYLMPEEEGETKDRRCNVLAKGLGITNLVTIPHYDEREEDMLDGINLWRDVVYPFFTSRVVMAIPDGTYILVDRDGERIMGECWAIKGGKREKISEEGEEVGVEKEKA